MLPFLKRGERRKESVDLQKVFTDNFGREW